MAETFDFAPSYAWEYTSSHRVNVTTFESGAEQRAYVGASPRKWALSFAGPRRFIEQIRAFYDARKGPYEAFNWTPPGSESALTARFCEDSLSISFYGLSSGSCELSIVEVL